MGKLLSIYGVIVVYLILSVFILNPANIPYFNTIVNPLIWLCIAGISYFLSRNNKIRIKKEYDKFQNLLIIMILYIIIYFGSGLLFGFQKTPYAKDFLSIIKNIWAFGSLVFLEEIVRHSLIKMSKNKKWSYILTTILLIFVQINFVSLFSSFGSVKSSFIYIASIIMPFVAWNILLTYLSYIGGVKLTITYRLFITIPQFIVPIIPDLNWFLTAILGVILPVIVYLYLNYTQLKYVERIDKKAERKNNPKGYIPIFIVLVFLILFIIGTFKYHPIAVLSGSMTPYFNRGDALIIEKLNDEEKDNLKKGDVIQFAKEDKYYIHRIVKIEYNDKRNRVFVTKGDFNNTVDDGVVTYDRVVGKLQFIIPYIGYPSVWLSETLE